VTSEDKKERRVMRHKLQAAVKEKHFDTRFKAVATERQMKIAARKVADVLLSGKNPAIVHSC
jgi:hypothetical protein